MTDQVNPLQPLYEDRAEIIDHLLNAIDTIGCRTISDQFDAIDAWLYHQEIAQSDIPFICIRVALMTGMFLAEKHDSLRFFFETDPNSPLYGCICLANFQNQRGLDLIKASFSFCEVPRGRRLATFAKEIKGHLQHR